MLAMLGPITALLGIEAQSIKDRLKRQILLFGMLGALGFVAVTFLLVALYTALTYLVGPVISALTIAGGALLIGIIVFAIFHLGDTMEARREAEKKRSAETTALIMTAAITAIPLILPTLRKIGVPAGGAAAAIFSLLQAKALRRDD